MNTEVSKTGWPFAGAVVAALLLLTAILCWQTVIYLADIWGDISVGEYAHGYLVLAISLYLIVYNRDRLAKIKPCATYMALPLVLSAALLWLAAVLVDVEVLQAVALLFIVLFVLWVITGHQAMKLLAFPVLFIGFAIPIWFPLSPVLQDIAAEVVFWVTRMVGVPAFRQENIIIVPGGRFSIEQSCSGLRYLLAALTLGSLYAYLNYVSLAARVAVVAVVAAAALLANILRVFLVVYMGYVTEMKHPWVDDHLMLGWYLFGGLIVLLLLIDVLFYRPAIEGTTDGTADAGRLEVGSEKMGSEGVEPASACSKSHQQYLVITVLCVMFLATGPAILYQQKNQPQATVSAISFDLPADGWSLRTGSSNDWMPKYNGAVSAKTNYQVRGNDVSVFIAYYPAQKQGEEVINELNRISNKKVWPTKLSRPRIRRQAPHDVLEQVIENSQNDKRLIWYWYNIGGQATINKYQAKLLQLRGFITGKPQAYMAAVSIAVDSNVETSREALQKIIVDMEIPLTNLHVAE